MKKFIVILSLIIVPFITKGQELNCKVSVVFRQIQTTNTQIFKTLEASIEEFMNGRQWTGDAFQAQEKIECNMIINVNKFTNNENFQTSISIQARRPIYKASYNSQLINFLDKNYNFNYTEYDPIVFNENTFESNLSAVLAYYAYVIIGLDYDSYGENAGTPYFQKAESIVQKAQNASVLGWKPMENKTNRYWLVEQLLHPDYESFRKFFYTYHRLGLDVMVEDPIKGSSTIIENMSLLEPAHEKRPSSLVYTIFFDSKYMEIINMLKPLDSEKRLKSSEILRKVDPQHAKEYQELTQG